MPGYETPFASTPMYSLRAHTWTRLHTARAQAVERVARVGTLAKHAQLLRGGQLDSGDAILELTRLLLCMIAEGRDERTILLQRFKTLEAVVEGVELERELPTRFAIEVVTRWM